MLQIEGQGHGARASQIVPFVGYRSHAYRRRDNNNMLVLSAHAHDRTSGKVYELVKIVDMLDALTILLLETGALQYPQCHVYLGLLYMYCACMLTEIMCCTCIVYLIE